MILKIIAIILVIFSIYDLYWGIDNLKYQINMYQNGYKYIRPIVDIILCNIMDIVTIIFAILVLIKI